MNCVCVCVCCVCVGVAAYDDMCEYLIHYLHHYGCKFQFQK